MSGPAQSDRFEPDPFELIPLPIDFLSADGAIKVSLLESSGIPVVAQGELSRYDQKRALVARKDYQDAMRVIDQAPKPFLVESGQDSGGRNARARRRRVWLWAMFGFAVLWVLYGVLKSRAQPAAPAFEVASIHPVDPQDHRIRKSEIGPERYVMPRTPVRALVEWAYSLPFYRVIGGPDWIGRDGYDIEATIGGSADKDQIKLMVQSLLADRFRLKVHRETREFAVYALVAAKHGPKLRPARELDAGERPHTTLLYGAISARSSGAAALADLLTIASDRPVFDRTGLDGKYDFELRFDQSSTARNPEPRAADAGMPSIFTALQEQLGLRLEPQKSSLEVLVIDGAERPSGN